MRKSRESVLGYNILVLAAWGNHAPPLTRSNISRMRAHRRPACPWEPAPRTRGSGYKEGGGHSIGGMSGVMGEETAFVEKVLWRTLRVGSHAPTSKSGHDTSGLPHRAQPHSAVVPVSSETFQPIGLQGTA